MATSSKSSKSKTKARTRPRGKKKASISFAEIGQNVVGQFKGVDWRTPETLPMLPKMFLCACMAAMAFAIVWLVVIRGQVDELTEKQQHEATLKQEFRDKAAKVANLEPLTRQRQQAEEYVAQLEKQLPGKSEMDALLSDINQAGVGQNLQFELFKPGTEEVKEYYAQLPVAIRVSGKFPDIATFAADVAHLSRIVTLSNLNISAGKDAKDASTLSMEATANTFRYLDKNEKIANQKAKEKKEAKQ